MKSSIKIPLVMLVLLMVTTPGQCFAGRDARDGNWWLEQNKIIKLSFVTGFFDGIHLGTSFSVWGFTDDPQSEPCLKKVLLSNIEFEKKYLSKVKVAQLVDGLDAFYSDYRNRSILTDNAVWLVLNEIAGTPKEKLDKMVEAFRRNT